MTNTIDPDTIAQLAFEGLALVRDYNDHPEETPDERRAMSSKMAAAGIPFARLEVQHDTALALLDGDTVKLDDAKRLRVSVAYEALDAILEYHWPEPAIGTIIS